MITNIYRESNIKVQDVFRGKAQTRERAKT